LISPFDLDYTIAMPVTKTAKRALRGSAKKGFINRSILTKLDIAIRKAKNSKARELVLKAISIADIASKKKVLHKNKSARIKSQLSKFLPKSPSKKVKKAKK
jgi:ribosomal protein S20